MFTHYTFTYSTVNYILTFFCLFVKLHTNVFLEWLAFDFTINCRLHVLPLLPFADLRLTYCMNANRRVYCIPLLSPYKTRIHTLLTFLRVDPSEDDSKPPLYFSNSLLPSQLNPDYNLCSRPVFKLRYINCHALLPSTSLLIFKSQPLRFLRSTQAVQTIVPRCALLVQLVTSVLYPPVKTPHCSLGLSTQQQYSATSLRSQFQLY